MPEVNLNILQWEERIQIAIWPWVATQYSCPQKKNRIVVGVFTYPIFGIVAIDPCPCRLNLVDSILCDVLVKSVKCAVLIWCICICGGYYADAMLCWFAVLSVWGGGMSMNWRVKVSSYIKWSDHPPPHHPLHPSGPKRTPAPLRSLERFHLGQLWSPAGSAVPEVTCYCWNCPAQVIVAIDYLEDHPTKRYLFATGVIL